MTARSEEERYVGSMLLEPRSLFIMTDDAYTTMLHGIAERDEDLVEPGKVFNCTEKMANKRLERDTRLSITVRNVEKVSKLGVFDLLKK
uniref:2OG-FeII_Oxy_2 domain-containing protein n=1 Tax=Caenorhabditis tropicalis TaxID=1561998 RepID=A0A1I7TR27_9PELO